MALLLHGIQGRNESVMAGKDDVLRITCGSLCALCSEWQIGESLQTSGEEFDLRAAARHHEVLTKESAVRDTLPVRFGSVFSSHEPVLKDLADRTERYLSALDRVTGHVEYALRLAATHNGSKNSSARGTAATGRGHLMQKRKLRDARAAALRDRASLASDVAVIAEEKSKRLRSHGGRPDRLLDLSLMVPRTRVSELSDTVLAHQGRAERLGLMLELIGPWPLYSFCSEALDEPSSTSFGGLHNGGA